MSMRETSATEPEAGALRALCCECGEVRKVSDRYSGRRSEPDRFFGERGYVSPDEEPTETTYYRCVIPLKCAHCGRQTRHAYLRDFHAYRDQAEVRQLAEHRKREAELEAEREAELEAEREAERIKRDGTPEEQEMYQATLAMFDRFGIRYAEIKSRTKDADVTIERGGGLEVIFVKVRIDLPMTRKLELLRLTWAKMLPASDARWTQPEEWYPSTGNPGLHWQGYNWKRQSDV